MGIDDVTRNREVDMIKGVRLVVLLGALVALFLVTPPATRVVFATGSCTCAGYVYAYDLSGQFQGQGQVNAYDPGATDFGYCINFCDYAAKQVGAGLCSQYNLGGGQGYASPDYTWSFYDGNLYSAHVSGDRWDCP
jgi:hypothetical protein